ncbi:hypothetical protein, partial [Mycobacterium sp. E796]|uniref:hypothetical protein n=1 Tax=Mycobacterium sp. E796 TaxID=1834151 RepID=UPI001E2EF237
SAFSPSKTTIWIDAGAIDTPSTMSNTTPSKGIAGEAMAERGGNHGPLHLRVNTLWRGAVLAM